MAQGVLFTFVGALIGWGVSYFFYWRSTNDLRAKHAEQVRLQILSMRAMENAGLVKYNRSASGEITGLVIELTAFGGACASGSAEISASIKPN